MCALFSLFVFRYSSFVAFDFLFTSAPAFGNSTATQRRLCGCFGGPLTSFLSFDGAKVRHKKNESSHSSCNPHVNQRNITIEEIGLAVFASSHFRIFAYALYNNLPTRIVAVCDAHILTKSPVKTPSKNKLRSALRYAQAQ